MTDAASMTLALVVANAMPRAFDDGSVDEPALDDARVSAAVVSGLGRARAPADTHGDVASNSQDHRIRQSPRWANASMETMPQRTSKARRVP
jgi:hypothetical protein